MKKLISILIFLLVTMAFSADVKPFYFENAAPDSASQQAEFDYMLKYKLFGRDYLEMGTRVIIPDKSGWNGSAVYISANDQLQLGGTTLAGTTIKVGNEAKFLTGPIVALSLTTGNDNGNSFFANAICLADTNVSNEAKKGIARAEGYLTTDCSSLPEPPTTLSVPTITWPDTISGSNDIIINTNEGVAYIDVPDGEGTYDLYLNKIHTGVGGTNGSKIYIRMQDGGRLTRIFVHDIQIGNHTTINVVYRTEDGDEIQTQKQYRGNVLFYTDNDITFSNTDNVPIQGTFISTKKIALNCNLDFAGQLIANELYVGNDFKGENFKFVPFDTPLVDIDPELNERGGLVENDSTVIIPIKLSDTATVNVYFSYCFDLNENVTKEDFNVDSTAFPICGETTKTVMIPIGAKVPTEQIAINVKKDELIENNDTLIIRINIESGAVLPNNKTDGALKVKLIDAEYKNTAPEIDRVDTVKTLAEATPRSNGVVAVGKVNVVDDNPTKLDFALTDTTGYFTIGTDGTIYSTHVFDYETEDTTYHVLVSVNDGEFEDTCTYIIKITNVNEPIVVSGTINSVPENSAPGTLVGTIVGKDADSTTVTYTINSADFVINKTTGEITTKSKLDYETKTEYPVKVTVTSTDGSIKDTTFTIKVTDVNEPVHVNDTTLAVNENLKGVIGKVTAWDEDGKKLTYTWSDSTTYSIADGKITLLTPFDYETKPVDTLTVYVTDGTFKDSAKVVIKVGNVNEGIKTTSTINEISEFADIGTPVGLISAKDSDNVAVEYTTASKDFAVNKTTGVITVNKLLDYETQDSYDVKVYVTSKDGSKDSVTVTVKVKDENETPKLQPTELKIAEETTGTAGEIKYTELDKNPAFTKDTCVIVAGDTTKFKLDGNKVIVKQPIDFDKGDSVFYIKVKVTDKTDSTLFDTLTYKIKITPVNEVPEVTIPEINIPENCPSDSCIDTTFTNKFPVIATDPDGDKLTYVIDNDKLKIDQNGVISIVKPLDYEKDSVIVAKVYVSDDSVTISADVVIRVKDVNEPVHVKSDPIDVPENYTGPIGKVEASDDDGDKISYWVSNSTKYSIDNNGNITLKVPYDYESQKADSVIVFVTDNRGDTASTVVKINIKNEDEKSNVHYDFTEPEGKEPVYKDTVFINRPDVTIHWTADDNGQVIDTSLTPGKHVIPLCYSDPTKDGPACDTVVVLYSDEAPIITVATVDNKKNVINGQTIVDEPDGNQYVNNKNNDIKVTVKDPVDPTNDTSFVIKVDLHTIDVPAKVLENMSIEPPDPIDAPKFDLKYENVGKNEVKVSFVETIDGKDVTVSYIQDSTGKRIDDKFTVEYTIKVDGQDVKISYEADNRIDPVKNYNISYTQVNGKDTMQVAYVVNENGVVQKNKEGNVGYTISYSYTNKYGNTGTSNVFVILDTVVPKVRIITPTEQESYYTNSVPVVWTVDDIKQDTLNLERLEKGLNRVIRCYQDKALNTSCDTVYIFMKNAKDIEIAIVNPVTEINQDKVDEYYANGGKYSKKEPFQVLIQDPKEDKLPEPVGIGLKVNIVLPSVSSTGGLATIDDMIQTVNGEQGILVNKDGKLISGTSTGADGSYTIPVETYIENHCNNEYKHEYKKNGLEHTTIWDVKYKMHIWIFNNNSQYVNDFNFMYTLDDTGKANDAGILTMVVDWLAAKDGKVKSADGNAIATGAYLTKLEATSIATTRCDLPEQPIGTKVKKTENELTSFGYKRPVKK